MLPIKATLANNEYYHGTTDHKAIQILYEGFRFKKEFSDWGKRSTFKQGIYLTKSLEIASLFSYSYIIFKCRLSEGISLLRIDGKYDPKVIDYLKREFGKDLLTKDISKSIPRNKHLTRKELINLLNYRYCQMGNWKAKDSEKWFATLSSVRQQLVLHKYDAIGEPMEEVGIAVFNPSHVKALDIYHVHLGSDRKPHLVPFDKKRFVARLKEDQAEFGDNPDYPEGRERWNYIGSLLQRYCEENEL